MDKRCRYSTHLQNARVELAQLEWVSKFLSLLSPFARVARGSLNVQAASALTELSHKSES